MMKCVRTDTYGRSARIENLSTRFKSFCYFSIFPLLCKKKLYFLIWNWFIAVFIFNAARNPNSGKYFIGFQFSFVGLFSWSVYQFRNLQIWIKYTLSGIHSGEIVPPLLTEQYELTLENILGMSIKFFMIYQIK